jgi:DNA-3-methyladenine glycosylase
MKILSKTFYNRNVLKVAEELLGKILVREIDGEVVSGRIVEVEAYLGALDKASHSFNGLTKRNSSLIYS